MVKKNYFENSPGYYKLKEAFSLSNRDFLNGIEPVPEEDVYFSPEYEKKMARLIKRQERPYWKLINTVGKKIAVIAIVFLTIFGFSMTVKAVREPVMSFIENVFEKFSELFVDKSEAKNAPDKIEEVYTLTDLPEGYVETAHYESESDVKTIWCDGTSEIQLSQWLLSTNITIDNESADVHSIYADNIEAMYYYSDKFGINCTQIFWHTEKYSFRIYATKNFSEDEIIAFICATTKK